MRFFASRIQVHQILCTVCGSDRSIRWYLSHHLPSLQSSLAMAPHLTPKEQDLILIAHAQGKTTPQIHALVEKLRTKKDVPMVNITVLRRFLRGKTHKRSRVETRGRKRTLSRRNVLTGSSRSGANIARMGYGAVSTWSTWYRWASCPDARTMLMVLCIRLVFASACTHWARQTHSAGWLELLVPTCPLQVGTKSVQPSSALCLSSACGMFISALRQHCLPRSVVAP